MDWQEKLKSYARQQRAATRKMEAERIQAVRSAQKAKLSNASMSAGVTTLATATKATQPATPNDWKENVTPLSTPPRAAAKKQKPAPHPVQREKEVQTVLRESLSDDFDVDTLLETDDTLSYRAAGVGADALKRLRRGHWTLQAELDLHGLRRDEARLALSEFIRRASAKGLRCVRIIHGKGLGSTNKTPVLKSKTQSWLVQKREVLAFVQARPADGGSGALVVLLRGGA